MRFQRDSRFFAAVAVFMVLFLSGCAPKVPNTWQARVVRAANDDNISLFYREAGQGTPLVMLHGFGADSYSFSRLIPKLAKKYHIYALDLKGFGKSPKPPDRHYSVYDQAVLVERFLKRHHLHRVILLGHSYGGGVALSLALMDPGRIKQLVLIDSASYAQQLPKLIRWLRIPILGKLLFYLVPASVEVRASYRYAFYDPDKIPEDIVREYAANLYLPNARSAYLQAVETMVPEDIGKIAKQYRTIHIPTLIIWGENDIVIRKEKAFRLHRDLPDSRLFIIPRCGHIPHEEKPEEVLKILEKFMLK